MTVDKRLCDAVSALDRAPCGDVLAARGCAQALLDDGGGPVTLDARLLLTAALTDLQGRSDGLVSAADLRALIQALGQPSTRAVSFSRSPVSLVRFVAAELTDGVLAPAVAQLAQRWARDPIKPPVSRRTRSAHLRGVSAPSGAQILES